MTDNLIQVLEQGNVPIKTSLEDDWTGTAEAGEAIRPYVPLGSDAQAELKTLSDLVSDLQAQAAIGRLASKCWEASKRYDAAQSHLKALEEFTPSLRRCEVIAEADRLRAEVSATWVALGQAIEAA